MKQINETTYQSDNGLITFIQGDCMDVMNSGQHWSLAVVDPEYGISINHNIGRRKGDKHSGHKKVTWDSKPPEDIYFETLLNISDNQIVWGGNYFSFLWNNGCKGFIIWDKLFSDEISFSMCEMAWTSFNITSKILDTPRSKMLIRFTLHKKASNSTVGFSKNTPSPPTTFSIHTVVQCPPQSQRTWKA